MNRLFVSFDGDNAGAKIGQSVLMDDVQGLHDMSQRIEKGNQVWNSWVQSIGGTVISAAGDEGVYMIDPQYESQIEEVRQKYHQETELTCTVGLGNTLSQSGKALIAGKLNGKDQVIRYDENTESLLSEAHQHAQEGSANPEEAKMDDHYINSIMGDEMPSEDSMDDSQEEMPYEDMESPEYSDEEMMSDDSEEEPMDGMEYEDSEEMPMEDEQDQPIDEDMMAMPEDQDQEMMSDDSEEMPMEDDSTSEFSEEEPIEINSDDAILDDGQESEKDEPSPEMIEEGNPEELEADLADVDGNEELMQRIAANLAKFKENQELMEQIKQAKPDLYESILGLLNNMIELARMISPEAVDQDPEMREDAPQEEMAPEMMAQDQEMQDPK